MLLGMWWGWRGGGGGKTEVTSGLLGKTAPSVDTGTRFLPTKTLCLAETKGHTPSLPPTRPLIQLFKFESFQRKARNSWVFRKQGLWDLLEWFLEEDIFRH